MRRRRWEPWEILRRLPRIDTLNALYALEDRAAELANGSGLSIDAILCTDQRSKRLVELRWALVRWLREEWCTVGPKTGWNKHWQARRIMPRSVAIGGGLDFDELSWPIVAALMGMRHHTTALFAYRKAVEREHVGR